MKRITFEIKNKKLFGILTAVFFLWAFVVASFMMENVHAGRFAFDFPMTQEPLFLRLPPNDAYQITDGLAFAFPDGSLNRRTLSRGKAATPFCTVEIRSGSERVESRPIAYEDLAEHPDEEGFYAADVSSWLRSALDEQMKGVEYEIAFVPNPKCGIRPVRGRLSGIRQNGRLYRIVGAYPADRLPIP